MRRDFRILAATLLFGGALAVVDDVSDFVSDMDTFIISDVEVRGNRYLAEDEIVSRLAIEPGTSVWADADVWVERLSRDPLILTVDVTRRLPHGLVITVGERTPVALAPTPTLEPVDVEGLRLPLDPAVHRLDLPVLNTKKAPARSARFLPAESRALAAEVGRLMSADTAFLQRVSELGWASRGVLEVVWSEPDVAFLLAPGTPVARLREGLGALADASARTPDDPPDVIDLTFADQVVVRRTRKQ